MSPDLHLSERMPLVASGRSRWSAADENHLTLCEDCRSEWALVTQAADLGHEVESGLELHAIEAGVLAGLQAPVRRRSWRPVAWLIPLAAAATVVFAVLQGVNRPPPSSPDAVVTLLPELETLSSSELEAMLTLLPEGTVRAPDGFEDFTESELSTVIKDLEG
jgi:hypothetical protein